MKLDSARSLKQELLAVSSTMTDNLATAAAFGAFSARRATARP